MSLLTQENSRMGFVVGGRGGVRGRGARRRGILEEEVPLLSSGGVTAVMGVITWKQNRRQR